MRTFFLVPLLALSLIFSSFPATTLAQPVCYEPNRLCWCSQHPNDPSCSTIDSSATADYGNEAGGISGALAGLAALLGATDLAALIQALAPIIDAIAQQLFNGGSNGAGTPADYPVRENCYAELVAIQQTLGNGGDPEPLSAECADQLDILINDYVLGCTDSEATNYNPDATDDDGSCTYDIEVSGCTDSEATNYNPDATDDDGSCTYDTDNDGTLNGQDNDIDGDGVLNAQDDDVDGDGILNGQDDDIDGDGILNSSDTDMDGDGIPNSSDTDANGDGTADNGNDNSIVNNDGGNSAANNNGNNSSSNATNDNQNGQAASTYYDEAAADNGTNYASTNGNANGTGNNTNNGNTTNNGSNDTSYTSNEGYGSETGSDTTYTGSDTTTTGTNYTDPGTGGAWGAVVDAGNSFSYKNNVHTSDTSFDPASSNNSSIADIVGELANMTDAELEEYLRNRILLATGGGQTGNNTLESYHSATGDVVVANADGRTGTIVRTDGSLGQIAAEQLKYIRWAAELAGTNWRPIDEQFTSAEYQLSDLLALNTHRTYQEKAANGELEDDQLSLLERFIRTLMRAAVGATGNNFNTPTQMIASIGVAVGGGFSSAEQPRNTYLGAGIPETTQEVQQTIISENCLRGIELRAVGNNATGILSLECQQELQVFISADQQARAAEDPEYYEQLLSVLKQQQQLYNQAQQSGIDKTNYVDRTCFQEIQYGQLDNLCMQQLLQLQAANNPSYFTAQIKIVDEIIRTGGVVAAVEPNTSVQSDLTSTATKADHVIDNEYRLRGIFSRNLEDSTDSSSFDEIGSYFGTEITHRLLLDYQCDGTADLEHVFTTPYYSILPRPNGADVLISEYVTVPQAGLHCYAFEVDINNDIPESNEDNNLSNWREFITGFGSSEDVEVGSDGLPPLNFEISAQNDNGVTTHDWTSGDIRIATGQQIAFRWDAPQYQSCFPLLSSLTPDVAGNLSPVDRNTIDEHINLHEHTGYYELRCVLDDEIKVETIHVTVE